MSSGKGGVRGDSGDDALVAGSPPGEDESGTENEHIPFVMRYITLLSRLWGILTLTALWSFTVLTLHDLKKYNGIAPWYLLAIALLASFFELLWLINKCVTCRVGLKEDAYDDSMSLSYDEVDITRYNNCCCKCWRLLLWLDYWRKALLYIVFGVPMFIRELVTIYTAVCGVMLIILAALYFMKSFKESKCVMRKPRKHSYVQTTAPVKPKYVEHPVQSPLNEYPPASHGYDSIGHTNSVQPPKYSEKAAPDSQGTNYYRPFKDGMGNVKDAPDRPAAPPPKKVEEKKKSVKKEPESAQKQKSSAEEAKAEASKAASNGKSSPAEEGGFKLFGLMKKDSKRKEQVVPMVSSQRSHEEDLEHYPEYPEGKNPFGDDMDEDPDCEWDPNNRGNI